MTQFLAHSVFHTHHKSNLEKSSLNTVPLNLPVTRHCDCAFESVLICMNDCTLDPFSVAQQNGLSFFVLYYRSLCQTTRLPMVVHRHILIEENCSC